MASRLLNLRSTTTATTRWLSTASATASVAAATVSVTKEKPKTQSVTKEKPKTLYQRLYERKIRPDLAANIREIIDEWASQRKITRFEIVNEIVFSRTRKHYLVALQLSEWMESKKIDMNNADRAIRIDLLAKTRGIESAEMYFNSLQDSAKTAKTYGALLNCYCKEKLLDKALELFTKMKELDCTSTLNYSNVIALYLSVNQPEKVPLLVQEMEEKNFKVNIFNYNQLINSYAAQKDFDAIEKVLEDMQQKGIKCDCATYGNLATIHIHAGMHHKAADLIHKIKAENERDHEYFHTLITLYKELSDLTGVNRTWEALKSVFPVPNNASYLVMMLALSKLGDLESLEKYFTEWDSVHTRYDVRVTNLLLESYLQRDMIGEASALYESIAAKGHEPNLRTMELLTHYHIQKNQIDWALKYLEVGSAMVKKDLDKWFPNNETIEKFLEYFEGRNDADGAKKFCSIMKKIDRLDSTVCESLLSSQGTSHEVSAVS